MKLIRKLYYLRFYFVLVVMFGWESLGVCLNVTAFASCARFLVPDQALHLRKNAIKLFEFKELLYVVYVNVEYARCLTSVCELLTFIP